MRWPRRRRRPLPALHAAPYDPLKAVDDTHRITLGTNIGETRDWVTARWALLDLQPEFGAPLDLVLIITQGGREDLTAHVGDLLVWDGTVITVREGP